MPHLRIETNVPRSKIPDDFVFKAVPVLAKALGKPEQYNLGSRMPQFKIETNLPSGSIPKDFVAKAVPILADTLGKPIEYCVVSVIPDIPMSFGGSSEPCAIANVMSIGALGVEENKKHSKVLSELVEKELGVKNDRMYICFKNEASSDIGYKGTTFHTILG